jgi:polyphosphate kinase
MAHSSEPDKKPSPKGQETAGEVQRNDFAGAPISLDDPALFINRELSLLEFQRRVLEEAQDERNPLLERVRFLSIFWSNVDEFYMVRVAGLKKQVQAGVTDRKPDGLTPAEQLAAIRRRATELMKMAQTCYVDTLHPELAECGVHILNYVDLPAKQLKTAKSYFREVVYPILTPLGYDPGRPFPHISNLSLNLAVILRDEKRLHSFARIKVPESLPRLVPLKQSSGGVRKDGTVPQNHYFVWVEQIITAHLDMLFPGMEILEVYPFHVTRDADIEIQELEASDLLETIEAGVRKRRFGSVIRLMTGRDITELALDILQENLDVSANFLYQLDGPVAPSQLSELCSIEIPELKFPLYTPPVVPELLGAKESQIFERMQAQDILLHHPYDSFVPVIDFLRVAAADPNVLAIKQTLYRVGPNSPVVKVLLDAARSGKQVSVLVELKARFDEESNIEWVRQLEQEGVHVVYGFPKLKTHCKVALVVRQESGGVRRYVHVATGNYNLVTAHQYEDIGMLTVDEAIGEDATDLFNSLTGYSNKREYRKLIVAPGALRDRIKSLIQREIAYAAEGKDAHLVFKVNSLADWGIIKVLYEASRAGVQVDLIVRGICCLRPGIPTISENIRVTSVLGRFLEHSRVYYFHNGGDEEIYMGSADLMLRNLDHRVEVLFPVESKDMVRHIREEILETYLNDNDSARKMRGDGSYVRVRPEGGAPTVNVQQLLLRGKT